MAYIFKMFNIQNIDNTKQARPTSATMAYMYKSSIFKILTSSKQGPLQPPWYTYSKYSIFKILTKLSNTYLKVQYSKYSQLASKVHLSHHGILEVGVHIRAEGGRS